MTRNLFAAFALITASLLLVAPASAQTGFQSNYAAQPQAPILVGEILIGEALAEKADEYGERELVRLRERLRADLTGELERVGWSGQGGSVLTVTLLDATPNRPTMAQMASRPGLDMRSFSRGGARLEAVLSGADGAEIARYSYSWSTPNIQMAQSATTWSDAYRTFDRFAGRLVDDLQAQGGS